jgi:hypothetical protein
MTQQQWNQPAEDEGQMPLGVGGDTAPEQTFNEPKKPKVSGPTFVLFGAFASALVIIYLLGMQNKPQTASAEQTAREAQTTSAITELLEKNGKAEQLQGLFTDTKKLVKMFYSYLGSQKTEIPQLSHDPFGEPAPTTEVKKDATNEAIKIVTTNPGDAEKLRQVAEAFNGLKLQSVMMGRTSVAMINNRMVQVGHKIGDLTITAIESNRVLLSYEQSTFELKLSRPSLEK